MEPAIEHIQDPEETHVLKSHLTFPVVGIGASAGGVSALQRFFANMPADAGMAYVIVVHLSPDHESSLDAILQRTTRMPVQAVTDAVPIEADHVYVISPSKKLTMSDGFLRVSDLRRVDGRATSIDLFFRSLAQAHQERSVGIVLSGTGGDGTQGLKRVKELGGVSIAQSPEDAEYDAMPRSAIDSGLVDLVLAVPDMPAMLARLWANAQRLALPSPPADLKVERPPPYAEHLAEEALLSIKALLRERTGHNFTHYKRATVLRRLERRMQVAAVPDLPAYRRYLEGHPGETQSLLQDMLISVTNFFRDPEAFAALQSTLQAALQSRPRGDVFRAWIAGCATGEEAYSVAILLHELLEGQGTAIQVFASDIDQRAVAQARTGAYPASIATDVQPTRLRQFFQAGANGWRIGKPVRDSVIFSVHNVLSDPPFTRMDLICCRNLLIYLDRQAQLALLRGFHFALKPDGLLFLGSSETADAADGLFVAEDKRHRLYRADGAASKARPALTAQVVPAAPAAAALVPPAGTVAARAPLEMLHDRIIASHAPPTVLVDADDTVLHVGERASHLLRLPAGAPSHKLMALARPEIRPELRAALARAAETGASVEAPRLQLAVNGKTHHLKMSVHPASDSGDKGLFLVVFDETEETLVPAAGADAPERSPALLALEAELVKAQQQLQNNAGESAASTEELRASNEELQTINEELRSTTEELETSREELQAVNEELTTVNTELQLKIEETAQVNDDLQNLIVSAEIGTVFVDRGMRIKRYTAQAATLFNLLPSDVGRPLLDITHRLEYAAMAADVAAVFDTLHGIEREVCSHDGRWFLLRVLPYRTSEDHIDGAVVTFVDVTARRLAEEQLRLSEQRMRQVADSMRDYAIVTLDLNGLVTSWSTGAERVFGYTTAEIVGQTGHVLFTPEDRRDGVPEAEMRRARESGRADDDRWHLRKDGERILCSGIMSPLTEGGFSGYAKIARDFTSVALRDRHRDSALQEERLARGRLEQASVMKDEFLAVMSHELKNPLSVINMNAQVLSRLPQFAGEVRAERAAAAIKSAVASQVQIIDDLLDLSRVNTGKVVLAPAQVVLDEVLRNIAEAVADDVAAKRQTLKLELGPEPVAVRADPVRVEQIIWNLVTNAVKFTPQDGSIVVALGCDGEAARLDVSDNGVGLAPEHIAGIFEMFRQVDSGLRRRKGGLGIGLALVKQLTELHGGHVQATSAGLGQGSTFTVWLPLGGGAGEQPLPAPKSSSLAGLRLLVVDDEPTLLTAFGELLELESVDATIAGSAQKALDLALAGRYDVVVTDIAMPDHDGYWLLEQLRRHDETRRLPVIAVSGMARAADQQLALSKGFDAHLSKPLALSALQAAVARLRSAKGSRRKMR